MGARPSESRYQAGMGGAAAEAGAAGWRRKRLAKHREETDGRTDGVREARRGGRRPDPPAAERTGTCRRGTAWAWATSPAVPARGRSSPRLTRPHAGPVSRTNGLPRDQAAPCGSLRSAAPSALRPGQRAPVLRDPAVCPAALTRRPRPRACGEPARRPPPTAEAGRPRLSLCESLTACLAVLICKAKELPSCIEETKRRPQN